MTESQIEARLVEGVRSLGGIAYKFTSPGNVGVPDRLIVLPGGHVLFAELKTEEGRPSKIQRFQIDRLRRLGVRACLVRGMEGVNDFLSLCRNIIGRDKQNNAPENLMVFPSQAEHAKWRKEHDERGDAQ